MPVETGWCRDFSREPRPEPEEQMAAMAGFVPGKGHFPGCPLSCGRGQEQRKALVSLPKPRCSHSGSPETPHRLTSRIDCPQPCRCSSGELWPAASHKAGHEPPSRRGQAALPPARCTARAAPPRHTGAGRELPVPCTGWTWCLSVRTGDGAAVSARSLPADARPCGAGSCGRTPRADAYMNILWHT